MEATDLSDHSLNISTSKQRYSFPKQSRFNQQSSKHLCESYYELPTTRAKRTTILGYGQKDIGLSSSKTPGAGTYSIQSDINPEKHKYSAVTFGFARQKMDSSGPFGQVKYLGKLPAPNEYNNIPSRDFRAPALRSRQPDLEFEKSTKNPGPGTYQHEEMGQKKYYISSRYRNNNFGRISQMPRPDPIGRKSSVGPSDYNPVDSMNNVGKFNLAKNTSAASCVFSKSQRKGLANRAVAGVPGPGQYKAFSSFS